MKDLKIGIIGAGSLSSRRIYPYIGAAGGQLVGVCDLDPAKAEMNARRFGGRPYTNIDDMLERERPDAAIVCIGPEQHYELALKLMRKGIPVYTEKPSAPNADMALEMARVSQETGVLCTTAFKKRYSIAYNRAKSWLQMYAPEDHYSISVDYASGAYRNDSPRTSFLLDFAIHWIDLIGYLFGDVEEVFSFCKGLDAYAISLRFASGAVGTMNLNSGRSFSVPTEAVEMTVKGGNFMSIHNSSVWKIANEGRGEEWREPPTFTSQGDSGNETGHLAEIVDFIQSVTHNRTTRSNIYESYKSLVLYDAICKSAEANEVVKVVYQSV